MPTVLVVDDTSVDRRIAGGLLEEDQTIRVTYADNGASAIDEMAKSVPDLVITDLQMPEMGGLELVQRVRMVYPNVPVILMTAKGSETIAMEALSQGAASYVPKSQLNDRLLETTHDVLSMSQASSTYADLMACQEQIEISYSLGNNPELIDALLELVQEVFEGMKLFEHSEKCRTMVAVREALLNALYRGNLEIVPSEVEDSREDILAGKAGVIEQRKAQAPYSDRKIHVDLQIDKSHARFSIRDEGPGFDHASTLSPTAAMANEIDDMAQGRGLKLMRSFMDEVSYNDQGNQVTLVKRTGSG